MAWIRTKPVQENRRCLIEGCEKEGQDRVRFLDDDQIERTGKVCRGHFNKIQRAKSQFERDAERLARQALPAHIQRVGPRPKGPVGERVVNGRAFDVMWNGT